jgi:hypothetical protein
MTTYQEQQEVVRVVAKAEFHVKPAISPVATHTINWVVSQDIRVCIEDLAMGGLAPLRTVIVLRPKNA